MARMTKEKTEKEKEPVFRFMDLPVEIRCVIYQYLLQGTCTVETISGYPKANSRARAMIHDKCQPHISAGIILVSRQVFNESVSILYSANTFVTHYVKEALFFAKSIGSQIRYVRRIGFASTGPRFKICFTDFIQVLESAKRLEVLELPYNILAPTKCSWYYTPDQLVGWLAPLFRILHDAKQDYKPKKNKVTSHILVIKGTQTWCWSDPQGVSARDLRQEVRKLLAQALGEDSAEEA